MKQSLAFILALVLALAIGAPGAAAASGGAKLDGMTLDVRFIGDAEAEAARSAGWFTALPAAEGGYSKNAVVNAVVELTVPAKADGGNYTLSLTGKNVKFIRDEYPIPNKALYDALKAKRISYSGASAIARTYFKGTNADAGWELADAGDRIYANRTGKAVTYAWLVSARVVKDGASLTAMLRGGGAEWDFEHQGDSVKFTYDGAGYTLTLARLMKSTTQIRSGKYSAKDITSGAYALSEDGRPIAYFYFGEKFESEAMVIREGSANRWYEVLPSGSGVQYRRVSGAVDETIRASGIQTEGARLKSGAAKRALDSVYEDVIGYAMGMDIAYLGERIPPATVMKAITSSRLAATAAIPSA